MCFFSSQNVRGFLSLSLSVRRDLFDFRVSLSTFRVGKIMKGNLKRRFKCERVRKEERERERLGNRKEAGRGESEWLDG